MGLMTPPPPGGAKLPHALYSAAMKKMPASKIKNEQ